MIVFQEQLTTFLSQMFWIDIISIATLLFIVAMYIALRAKKIVKENQTYNESLRSVRVEIFHQYEKNFFL